MTLRPGTRLGAYEVLAPLGAGGMGEVYRAKDVRLGREVAIKVLPSELSGDASRLKRFEKEARSASALNHPNIVTVYDLGTTDGVSWIAMERVEGKTMRELLFAGAMPVKRLLSIAAQIGEGLSKAHEAGIVHRDLKPENVMVTKDGRVKVLDFGLAKLTGPASGSDEGSHLPTETGTSPGMLVGTAGYMSPEQASGQPVDFRSDQFAFGAMLYEMCTGKRAFQKKTGVDTLAAVINEEPESVGKISPQTPAPLTWIAERCLAKDPETRYASTKDLARDIATIRDHLSESAGSAVGTDRGALRRASRRRAAIATAALLGALLLGALAARPLWKARGATVPRIRQLTFRNAGIQTARFGPDGQTVVYTVSSTRDSGEDEIVSTRIGSPESRSLGIPSGLLLSISPSGEIAMLLGGRSRRNFGTLATVSLAGGSPREILENVAGADWAPDGRGLAVVRELEGKRRLEFPIGNVLAELSLRSGAVEISPKGDRIAFRDDGKLTVADLSGKKQIISGASMDFEWSPREDEIWFNEVAEGSTTFQAVTLSGRRRFIATFPGDFVLHDISRDGGLLLERASWEMAIVGRVAGEAAERNLSWLDGSIPVDISADGRTLLFNETGQGGGSKGAVYKRQTDGSPAVRLGEGSALALSPDGSWALCSGNDGDAPLVLIPTGPGQARPLPLTRIELHQFGGFFPDGNRIVILGSAPGGKSRLYSYDIESLEARPIGPDEVGEATQVMVSPDGTLVVCSRADGSSELFRVEGGPSRPIPAVSKDLYPIEWCADSRCLFVRTSGDRPVRVYRLDLSSGRLELWKEFSVPYHTGSLVIGVLPAPDGKSYVYGYIRYFADLFLAEGLE